MLEPHCHHFFCAGPTAPGALWKPSSENWLHSNNAVLLLWQCYFSGVWQPPKSFCQQKGGSCGEWLGAGQSSSVAGHTVNENACRTRPSGTYRCLWGSEP